jgi:hypothetical protein
MSCRTLTSFLWTAAVAAALGLPSGSQAKPPDLPIKTDSTVTPDVLPDSDWDGAAPLPKDDAGNVVEALVPMSFLKRPAAMPWMAHLPPVQRRQFASLLLYGVHPLLLLVPTDRLVDLPCDHPGCPVVEERTGSLIVGVGVNSDAGLTGAIVPLPKDVHGTIEMGFGFSLNGAPTYKFLVTEYWGCGNCRKDETFRGCVETFVRALLRELCPEPEPAKGSAEESNHDGCECPPTPRPCDRDDLSERKIRYLSLDEAIAIALEQGGVANPRIPEKVCPCEPGVAVMVDGLMKSCYLSLVTGRFHHAADLARQAFALDPKRVEGDPVMHKLLLLTKGRSCHADCCDDCPGCPDCPCCIHQKAIAKPYRETNDAPAGVGKSD